MIGFSEDYATNRITRFSTEWAKARWLFFRARRNSSVQGVRIIHLELGEPRLPSGPSGGGRRARCSRGGAGSLRIHARHPALREAISGYLKRTRRLDVAPEQVLVAPGCKMALSLAMMALIEPGDEVLYPDPGFPIYPSFTARSGRDNCAVWA